MSQSQALRVLDYMVRNDGITSLTAANKLFVTSLHRRLSDLREMGVLITRGEHPNSNCLVYRALRIPKHVRKQLNCLKKCEVAA